MDLFILFLAISPLAILAFHLWFASRTWRRYTFAVARRKVALQSFAFASLYFLPVGLLSVLYFLDSNPPAWRYSLLLIVGLPYTLVSSLMAYLSANDAAFGIAGCALSLVLNALIFYVLALCVRFALLSRLKANSHAK